jgi:hypothetical protein
MTATDRPDQSIREVSWTDLHLPVFSVNRDDGASVSTAKLVIYGTAFPVAPGYFATASHVLRDAAADGEPVLSLVEGAGAEFKMYRITQAERVDAIDFALLECPSLAHLAPLPIDFDRRLGMLRSASAVGFPVAVEAEYVHAIARGFAGYVVCRRELYHLPGQPPGYELSFSAPQGLSGAPLISAELSNGEPFCYGWIVQQGTLGVGDEKTAVGVAVSVETLLSVNSKMLNRPLAALWGREFVTPAPRSAKRLPGGVDPQDTDPESGWPDA